jgi:hypothetical protein
MHKIAHFSLQNIYGSLCIKHNRHLFFYHIYFIPAGNELCASDFWILHAACHCRHSCIECHNIHSVFLHATFVLLFFDLDLHIIELVLVGMICNEF